MSDLSWWDARIRAGSAVEPGSAEAVAVRDALGRTLARDANALVDLPSFATAAMDGWVVSGDGPWTITGTIDTGTPVSGELSAGQAMRIATGCAIPSGSSAVVPWEVARVEGEGIGGRVHAEVSDKIHIRSRGEECAVGDVLARAGDVVNPALIGSLSAAGIDQVSVVRPLKFLILVLGDEVIESGLPTEGTVRDALGVQLPSWVQAYGGEVVANRRILDDPTELEAGLRTAVAESDVVIATGGTARGHRDFLRSTLERLSARFLVDGVAVRPGHPMMIATVGGTPVVGLPGNPLSALVAMVTLIEPLVDTWNAREARQLPQVQIAEGVAPSAKDLTRLMVGRRELGGFRQVQRVSSAMLRGIAHADGWAVIPASGVVPGEVVPWIPVPWVRRTSDSG